MLFMNETPAAKARYMPKAHSPFLSQILPAAWRRHEETLFPEDERLRVGEIVAAELERRNPAADMDVLERYGLTELEGKPETTSEYVEGRRTEIPTGKLKPVTVSVFNPYLSQWDRVGVIPARTVRTASRSQNLTANGRAARRPAPYGVTPENYERHLREGTWAGVVENNEAYFDALAAESLPEETDAFFQRVIDLRRDYRDQYQGVHNWLGAERAASGKYPTWAAIEERFPFIGRHMAALREGGVG